MMCSAGTILSVPLPEDILGAAKAPIPKIEDMRSMTVYEVGSAFCVLC